MDHTATAGPSRKTRHAHTQRLQSLQTNPAGGPASSLNKKHKAPAGHEEQDGMLWTLLAEVNAKAKGKEPPAVQSASAPVRRRGRPPKSTQPKASTPVHNDDHSAHTIAPLQRRRTVIGSPMQPPPAKRRKLDNHASERDLSLSASITDSNPAPPKRKRREGLRAAQTEEEEPSVSASAAPLKRVKLIVRKPPPVYTHPLQRPPLPQFGSSLDSFLRSYKAPNDVNMDEGALEEAAHNDLVIWRQVDNMRRQGRMIHRPPDSSTGSGSGSKGPQRAPDLWDQIILEVQERHRVRHYPTGEYVASQVASRVVAYWEAQAARDDKARALEEKRLRALAKATIRLVTAKWKEAVYVSLRHFSISSSSQFSPLCTVYSRSGAKETRGRGTTAWSRASGRNP